MTFAFCGPDGGFLIIVLLLFMALAVACVVGAVFATIGLARWAAARHNRLAANES
ncbi:MAG TPA: hypothetical protein VF621_12520 [Pyrinomonadaceae bacterium]|jgi:hypothetical protein